MSPVTETALLAPVEIWEVILNNSTIKFHKPLILTPTFMPDDPDEPDENEYLTVDVPELAISSHGITTEELESAIRSDIRFAWRHFVQAEDYQLAPDAMIIKKSYLAIAEAVDE
jgi:hypothetical protein